tara:strand:- start:840 stop:1064 length:225 start_codon:yes stop_codon:yes gene_type:complete
MKVKIMQRSVYHKYAEIEIEIPDLMDGETEVNEWLLNNEDKWDDKIQIALDEATLDFVDSEWMYMGENGIGGHI